MSDVAIVGMGAVFPGAGDAPAFWRNISSGVDAITEVPPDRWDPDVYYRPDETGDDRFYCRRGGFVDDLADFDPARFGIMPNAVHGIEPDQLLVLRAAAEAIADSGNFPERERTGVIIGRGGYLTPGVARLGQRVHTAHQLTAVLSDLVPGLGPERLDAVRAAFTERLGPERAESSIGLVPNFAASRLANRFDLRGPAYTVDAACASSLVAVDHAVRELASGRCDAVLAGGAHTCHHPTIWSVFTQLRALSPGELIRPFDSRADGTLLSEGAGVVLLKRLADALEAGNRIYAVIRGVGVASDGRATSMINPLAEGQELAMRQAWAAAGLDPEAPDALGLLEAHGTATPVGDQVELAALERVFGPPGGAPIGIGTVKSMIGHAMPAAGIAGLIKATFAVHHGVLPPTLHVEQPHPALARTRFEPVTRARPWDDGPVRRAAVSAFGFGGINAHVILEAPAPPTRRPANRPPGPPRSSGPANRPPGPPRPPGLPGEPPDLSRTPRPLAGSPASVRGEAILRLAADSPRELGEWLDVPDDQLLARADREPGPGSCRLAIVAPDPRKLALARKITARGTPWRGRSDVWFTPVPLLTGPGQVAFLFPGFEPEFAPRIEGVAERFGLPAPRLHGGNTGDGDGDGDIIEHALDVVAVGRLFAGALSQLGITPGVLAGHSLGEWTAMIVAGIYPEIDAFMASMRPGMAEVPDLVYLALGAPADRVAELLGDDVVVTHDNCPSQSVVCGPAARVTDVVERARAAGILAQTLPFRTGFHSPMYAPYLAAARELLGRLEVRPASVPVWSATSLAPFPRDPDRMRELVLRHLVEPVRFRQLTERLYESGVRAFVQVGPGSLTGFAEDTLRDRDRLIVATAVSQRDGLAQLRRVAAALWADGLSPRFDRLGDVSQGGISQDRDPQDRDPQDSVSQHGASQGGASQGGASQGGASQGGASQSGGSQRSVRLRLGGPLIRLTGAMEPIATAGPLALPAGTPALLAATPGLPAGAPLLPADPPLLLAGSPGLAAGAPVLAEFGALMAETTAAAGAVTEALIRPPGGPAPERAATPPRASGDGHDGRGDEISTTLEFSLLTMPELADHGLILQAEGWPEDSDRFPVVPMATMLEVMADAALALAPGHVVVGFEKVRAMRWLTVAPATTARVHAARDGGDRVRVSIEGYASSLVLIADAYPPAPPAAAAPRRNERPAPVTARELYEGGWMFHGPRFAGVADILSVADDGITGSLLCLPARGALLDSAGQLIGHWMQVAQTVDHNVLPTGIGAVRLYGPQPPAGERLGATVWIRELAESDMRADAELRTGDGRVWCRITGWTTRRFATDDAIWQVKLRPGHNALGRLCPGGWNVLQESWPDTASRDLMMRQYLNAAERARYERLNPLQQRRWLLGCMTVKDAVRRWLWDRGAGPIYPAEITVDGIPDDAGGAGRASRAGGTNGASETSGAGGTSGRPRVRGPFRAPHVSLAYRPLDGPGPACAVAICGDEPVDFTVDTGDDGTLLVAQPGRAVRPLDAATPVAAQTAKGHS